MDVKDNVLFLEVTEAFLGHAQIVATDRKALEPVVAVRISILSSRITGLHVSYRDLGLRDGSALRVRHGATRGTHTSLCEYCRRKAQRHHQPSYQRQSHSFHRNLQAGHSKNLAFRDSTFALLPRARHLAPHALTLSSEKYRYSKIL